MIERTAPADLNGNEAKQRMNFNDEHIATSDESDEEGLEADVQPYSPGAASPPSALLKALLPGDGPAIASSNPKR